MKPTTEDVLLAATIAYGVPLEDITQRCRKREILRLRQVVQYMCKRLDTDILKEISHKTGVIQHGTTLHSYHLINREADMYRETQALVYRLEDALIGQGFDITSPTRKLASMSWHAPRVKYLGNHLPVKITNRETGETKIVDSVWEAHRQTGAARRGITKECRKIGKVKSKYKFSYDE